MEEGKAYIESGILELYVLGQLNEAEAEEVLAMAAKYPEVRQEMLAIELAMERYANHHAVVPKENVYEQIVDQIEQDPTAFVLDAPNRELYSKKLRILRFALAACIAMLIVSLGALYSVYYDLSEARVQIASLYAEKDQFTVNASYMKGLNAELKKLADLRVDPDWKVVNLAGTPGSPNSQAVVYWHTTGKHVIMDNYKMQLPDNDADHQYQLWGLINGKPVDLGVFDIKSTEQQVLIPMKDIPSVQTFAVTLEKRGGSASPTLDQMVVAGNVAI